MTEVGEETVDVVILPMADGRQIMLPLATLAEVWRLQRDNDSKLPEHIDWRGYQLKLETLDHFFGGQEPDPAALTTVGIFRASADSEPPFRALAFAGNASHQHVNASLLEPIEQENPEGLFVGAARLNDREYLIPDLQSSFYNN